MKKLVLMMTAMLCLGVMSCGNGSKAEENDTIKKDTCVMQSDTTVNEMVDTISL